ncbi:cytochrome P450 [Ramaria rubella]|nr:cytochrome P450 [Ramaria rubella]
MPGGVGAFDICVVLVSFPSITYRIHSAGQMPFQYLLTPFLAIPIFFLLRIITQRPRRRSMAYLPGPPPGSWLIGNAVDMLRSKEYADPDFAWTREYGNAIRIRRTFGGHTQALHYILNTTGYNFPKPYDVRAEIGLMTGRGIVFPARPPTKDDEPCILIQLTTKFSPDFQEYSTQAAFDYHFAAIDEGSDNKFCSAYSNLMALAFLELSDAEIVIEDLWCLLPQWLISLTQELPVRPFKQFNGCMRIARGMAKELVERQAEEYKRGNEGGKDVMSILESKNKLHEEEILAQLTRPPTTTTFVLHELSRHPDVQQKVRQEIGETKMRVKAMRGHDELSVEDLDGMMYLGAVVKETLRFHPIVHGLQREAGQDDVIPLMTPQRTRMGEEVKSIPVSKGQHVFLSIAAYNRLTSIWGNDADQWRPERFLEEGRYGNDGEKSTQGLGVLANLATFSSGVRGCIGWRFAIIEMQAIIIELISAFDFSPAPGVEIVRGAARLMTPMIKGSGSRRTELPMVISVL